MDLDFGIEVTGFETGESYLRIEGLASAATPSDAADDLPARSGPVVPRDVLQLWREWLVA